MSETTASRTLVKSPPELWAECSDASALTRHLDQFGEITITKLEPETAVAWEGERVSGTVRIEPSGWGTRVTLTARHEAEAEPEPVATEPEAEVAVDSEPVAAEPEPVGAEPEPVGAEPEPVAVEAEPQPEPETVATELSRGDADSPQLSVEVPAEAVAEPVGAAPRARKGGLLARLIGMFRAEPVAPVAAAVKARDPISVEPVPLAAEPEPVAAEPDPVPVATEPEPVAAEPEPVAAEPEPVPADPGPVAPSPAAELAELEAALSAALDSLGQAHHRPFSRA